MNHETFSNDSLSYLLSEKNNKMICFAKIGSNYKMFTVRDLLKPLPLSLRYLQLFKIPGRRFLPYFFVHTISNGENGDDMSNSKIERV